MQRYENLWRKRQLLPAWILQILCSLIFGVVSILLLAAAGYISNNDSQFDDYDYYGYSTNDLVSYAAVTGAVVLALAGLTIVFDIVEMVLYKKRALDPVLLLVFATLKTAVWTAYFVLSIVAASASSVSLLDIILSLILAVTSVTQLVFGAKFTHRKRKGLLTHQGKTAGLEGGYGYGA